MTRRSLQQAAWLLSGLSILGSSAVSSKADAQELLHSPVACAMGVDCFVQQFPDLDSSAIAKDPWCGPLTYDGHDGIDIRVRTFAEIGGVDVLAVANGTILRTRDGIHDKLMMSEADRIAVEAQECGNGVVMDTAEGLEIQYCHLAFGSVIVSPGDEVTAGQSIGLIGASGMAQFPHVHVTVRKDGVALDTATGRNLDQGCSSAGGISMWEDTVAPALTDHTSKVLGAGFAGSPIDHDALALGAPAVPQSGGWEAFVGWAWFMNLAAGDIIKLRILDEQGQVLVENQLEPLDRDKATYSAFVGKRTLPPAGAYRLEVSVNGRDDLSTSTEINFQP